MDEDNQNPELKPTKPKGPLLSIGLALLLVAAAFFSGIHLGEQDSRDYLKLEAGLFSLFAKTPEPALLPVFPCF